MTIRSIRLGINIDHVATVRQARGGVRYPDPVKAALIAQDAGADGITLHLREDRRHIQERDVDLLLEVLEVPMNLEISASDELLLFAEKMKPAHCCLVPEKRQELTTEGGLDVAAHINSITVLCKRLKSYGIKTSLFIDPDTIQVEAAKACGSPVIELHTGCYANAQTSEEMERERRRIVLATKLAHRAGLIVNAGHGLHYQNVKAIAAIPMINELNIGHSIIARAVLYGMKSAVSDMKKLMLAARL